MAVQEEVEIALDELVDKVECDVLLGGLPEPVPVDIIEFLLHEKMTGKVADRTAAERAVIGPYRVGETLVYIPCDWFPPECAEYEGSS
mmetsp:Transcript_126186/g.288853  ORF Transcript_126186/g.288853 Transcript_126186/m.288853 type:complete len:88 (+) Transcript_126186:112-375(+)